VAVDVGGGQSDRDRRVGLAGDRQVAGRRRVVHGGDGNGRGRRRGAQHAVVCAVGEGVHAVVVRRGHVYEAAVRVELNRAVRGCLNERGRDRTAIDVDVVRQNAGRGDRERRVFGGGVLIRGRNRRVVDRRDRHRD